MWWGISHARLVNFKGMKLASERLALKYRDSVRNNSAYVNSSNGITIVNNSRQIFETYESEARSYCRSIPVVFSRAQGATLTDETGKTYLDFISGAGALNYGHNCPSIKQGLIEYLEQDGVIMALDMHSVEKAKFIQAFQSLILQPRNLDYKLQFTSPTGTSVVESAVKLAKKYTKRDGIVAFTNGYHGMTGISLALTGNSYHRQAYSQGNVFRLPFDGYIGDNVDTMAYFRQLLDDKSSGLDLPAAVIVETIQGEGGLNTASISWLKELRNITREYGIVLIVDEVQTGCGRTGNFFSFERASIKPDLVCLSKSIGGMGLPFALLLVTPDMDLWKPGEDNGTFRGNNLAFVASRLAIEQYWTNDTFQRQITEKSKIISNALNHITREFPLLVKGVKGLGLMQGLEFFNAKHARSVVEACFEAGLIIETCGSEGEVLKLMCPLNIDDKVLNKGLAIIRESIVSSLARGEKKSTSTQETLSFV